MTDDLPSRLAEGATVVVGSGLAARQLEAFLTRSTHAERPNAWVSDAIEPYPSWTTALWSRTGNDSRQLLTTAQALALWRQIIDDSAVADRLINSHSASRCTGDCANRSPAHCAAAVSSLALSGKRTRELLC